VRFQRILAICAFTVAAWGSVPSGPEIGQTVPEFSLPDQTGRTQTLESIMGPKGALLVFYRSADW